VFEIVVNQYVHVCELLLLNLRNSRLIIEIWVPAKTVPVGGDLKTLL
jgi:hypothetical protein